MRRPTWLVPPAPRPTSPSPGAIGLESAGAWRGGVQRGHSQIPASEGARPLLRGVAVPDLRIRAVVLETPGDSLSPQTFSLKTRK